MCACLYPLLYEKNPVKTAVAESYVILVMFAEVFTVLSPVYREVRADERLRDTMLHKLSPGTGGGTS